MPELKCPFSTPLVTHQFGCARAQEVVRRGGAETDCTNATARARCERVFEQLKAAALPAFGVEDDLLSMPHSVRVKIQCGGLLGVQRLLAGAATVADRVEDIDQLLTAAEFRFGAAWPAAELTADMTAYRPRARRR